MNLALAPTEGGRRHACVREILVWVSCFGDLAGLALTCVRRYVCESGTVCRWKQLCNLERYVVYFGMFVWLSLEEVEFVWDRIIVRCSISFFLEG